MSITRRLINRELFTKDNLTKHEQFRKNMIELEEQDAIYGSICNYTLSEVIYEDLIKQYGVKIKVLSDIKQCNDFNYDSIYGLYKEIERNTKCNIYVIAMLGEKIIMRGNFENVITGYYRRKSGIKLKPGPKPKDGS